MEDLLSVIAIIISIITPAAIWLSRTWFKAWLDARITTKSAKEVETLKSDLEKDRQALTDLRNSVLSGQAARQSMMDQKRLDAMEQLWISVQELDEYRIGPEFLQKIDIEKASELLKSDPSIQQFFSVILKTLPDLKDREPLTRTKEPFIPLEVWKFYQAYQTIIFNAYLAVTTLAHGLDSEKLLKNVDMKDSVLGALPSYAEFMDKYGNSAAYFLVKTIRAGLVEEMRQFSSGKQADEEHLKKATEIALKSDFSARAEFTVRSDSLPEIPDSIKSDTPAG